MIALIIVALKMISRPITRTRPETAGPCQRKMFEVTCRVPTDCVRARISEAVVVVNVAKWVATR